MKNAGPSRDDKLICDDDTQYRDDKPACHYARRATRANVVLSAAFVLLLSNACQSAPRAQFFAPRRQTPIRGCIY